MPPLKSTPWRAAAVIAAGSDVALHCNGDLAEMEAAAAQLPELSGKALDRFSAALARLGRPQPFDTAAAVSKLQQVLADHAASTESV